jgi:N,N'-diacetyllegionaminate synthase
MEVFLIAEIAQAHDGSVGILHSYIDALSKTGVNAIKFQTHIADAESSSSEPFRINFSYEDKTRFDYWKRMEFTFDQWLGIKTHCESVGLEFISSPFSIAAVDLLEKLNVKKYKIGSGEINNYLMLEKIALTGKDIILSTGLSDFSEIDQAYSFLKSYNNKLTILQCTTKYPTNAEDVGLTNILKIKERYNSDVGLSDHSSTIYPSIAAVSLGARVIEFHAVFDKNMFGPDSKSSLTISEIKQLVEGVRFIEKAMKIEKADDNRETKKIFEKSLAVNRNLKSGDILLKEFLESKKPYGMGISAKKFTEVVGKKLRKDLDKWSFLNYEDLVW